MPDGPDWFVGVDWASATHHATLLAEAAEPLQRRDYHALRSLAGVAPVTRRSGKRRIVLMRQACQMRLRTAVYH